MKFIFFMYISVWGELRYTVVVGELDGIYVV